MKIKKNNKIFITILIIILFIFQPVKSKADDVSEYENDAIKKEEVQEIESNIEKSAEVSNNKLEEPIINSKRYVVYDRNTGSCVYGKNENKPMSMASTTKIMTAIIVIENCKDLNQIVTIDAKSASTGGSRLGLKKEDKISINDLLYGLLMRSGNDAAMALAIYIAGSKEAFAKLMNSKALELKLINTHFVTPYGLDDPNHYTTAYELAKITDYALKKQKIAEIVNTQYATIHINDSIKELKNTNELLGVVEGVYGVKTGFTNGAGRCLVTAIKRNNMDLIIVVLGADTKKYRGSDTIKLVNYIAKNYRIENLESYLQDEYKRWKELNENRIYIDKSETKIKTALKDLPIKSIITNKNINVEITSLSYLEAPIEENTRIGTVTIKNGENIIEEIEIVTREKVKRKNPIDYLITFCKVVTK